MCEWSTTEPKEDGQHLCQHQGYYVVGTYLVERRGVFKKGWYFYRPSDGGLVEFTPDKWKQEKL